MSGPTVAFTVDLEPDCPPFLSGFRGVEHGLPALLDVLERLRVPATFFTTGEVAERYPEAVAGVVAAGHELGCHGMTHTAFTTMSRDAARDEIETSASILRRFAPVTSFRAPYLRFPDEYVD
ncbi:MAG: polysaccharide deacetylase family protein, partial [Gemmatimonadaceae bacterium]